ncbi:hypothetical protein NEUTE1DRAFT_116159 [Neurospora tetrasperma FGSC 2508]|uniref:Uncharacterized protein n=1 Tax=Neurospora tetrasperma (strain FGSC 2508 / ATCC MYA-4615 / P0657) TaxID=510951 RepID=F8MEB1_NEUT8|nr:uncharacterized protein NEUTE1DRAFT_116159 [Neurospora tetrasperma FGSC 2508]EGO61593.1 hypothetical protein NEUTE1DRAFT_116159 [Neurospora tetrasperma FGSC 2508]EGZ67551.1 hypothetical protein NEUTE2DRAFT_146072 [Neurospora tetrasperma FGSC 2509]
MIPVSLSGALLHQTARQPSTYIPSRPFIFVARPGTKSTLYYRSTSSSTSLQ